jgi:SAM-dependent methyltransferase
VPEASIYQGEKFDRATSQQYLDTRIALNQKYSAANFNEWLFSKLKVLPGQDILDVGCGTGAQAIPFLHLVGPTGSVTAIDISKESVLKTLELSQGSPRIQAVAGDMADVAHFVRDVFTVKRYDLALSAYALYYTKNRVQVLDVMRQALKADGSLAVFTPNHPHGMVEFVRRFSSVPQEVVDCLHFGPQVLEPYFRRHFLDVSVYFFHNVLRITSLEDFFALYRSTTYYSAGSEPSVGSAVGDEIDRKGFFEFEKNGYLIVGRQHSALSAQERGVGGEGKEQA